MVTVIELKKVRTKSRSEGIDEKALAKANFFMNATG